MAISLNKTIKRQVSLHGLTTPVNISFLPHGIEMTVAGARTKIFGSWERVAKALHVPDSVPSIYHDKPFELLKHLESKQKKGQ